MKKAVFVGVLGLGMIAVLEAVSFLALAVRDGGMPSFSLWEHRRALVVQESGGTIEVGPANRGVEIYGSQVLHPFLGFVYDPSGQTVRNVTAQGFPIPPGGAEPPAKAPRFVVAVFGGSVAEGFCEAGREAFLQELRRSPRVQGKAIVVHCFAMGGYKQPQQLMALNYALSLGEPIDLAINVDGFNEVALAIAENLKDGIYPFYPRRWSTRVEGAPAVESLRLIGRIAAWRDERLRKAGLCVARPLAWSPACHLLWTALDRRLAQRVFEAEQELARLQPPAERFVARGPAFKKRPRPKVCRVLAEHWARSSTLMFDLCRARGIPYLHFLQPNQVSAGLEADEPRGRARRRQAGQSLQVSGRGLLSGADRDGPGARRPGRPFPEPDGSVREAIRTALRGLLLPLQSRGQSAARPGDRKRRRRSARRWLGAGSSAASTRGRRASWKHIAFRKIAVSHKPTVYRAAISQGRGDSVPCFVPEERL